MADPPLYLNYFILGDETKEHSVWGVEISRRATAGILVEKLAETHNFLDSQPRIYEHFISLAQFPHLDEEVELFKKRGLPPLHAARRLSNVFDKSAKTEGIHFIVVPHADALKPALENVDYLKQHMKIRLDHTRELTRGDMELNNIAADLLPHDVCVDGKSEVEQSALPEPARGFHDMLIARMKVTKFVMKAPTEEQCSSGVQGSMTLSSVFRMLIPDDNIEAFSMISILKDVLQDKFSDHFEEVLGYRMDQKHMCQLSSYVGATFRHLGRAPGFTSGYSAMAKEVSIAAILVDPVIDGICPGYERDQKTLTTLVEYENGLVRWKPREDFCVAYGRKTARYALLNGESEMTSENEEQSMYKMSVVSKYSHDIIRQLIDEETVILSAYVSETICTMYLFYKTSDPVEPYVMKQILWIRDIFTHPTHIVGFLRRLNNFAANVKPLDENLSPTQVQKQNILERLGNNILSAKTDTPETGSQDTARRDGRRMYMDSEDTDSRGGEKVPCGAADQLAVKYKTISSTFGNHAIKRVRPISSELETAVKSDLVAKWTTDASEVELVRSLQSATNLQYRNSVIKVVDIVRYGTIGTFVVMPRYTPLSSLSRMTINEYHNLRLQVVEGVAFLHAERIAHRDLKTANIVVDLKPGLSLARIYIIDFGIARRCTPEYRCEGFRGTNGWTAPEVQDGARWEPMSADVWAMAKTILCLAALAGTPDQVMSDIVACHEPSFRPTAAALLDKLQIARPRPAKRPNSASAELPQAKFQTVMKADDDAELEDE
ncbi:hypothetical protein FRB95_004800 [Tulasnella sp. JGI-2019a]|nr:hypothetical protein FRB95_004800 [Tulasnella sp. JGI-2019a]